MHMSTGVVLAAFLCVAAAHARQDPVRVATVADDGAIAAPPPDAVEDAWPRVFRRDAGAITVYPPTLKSWTGDEVTGVCAMAVAGADGASQTYGTMSFSARTVVNKLNRVVELSGVRITGVSLPENPAGQVAIQDALAGASRERVVRVSLDRFEAAVPAMTTAPTVPAAPLRNDPPDIRIVPRPTVLVPVQGPPVLVDIAGSTHKRVLNTPMLLLRAPSGAYWLKIADGWMTAGSLAGPWSVGKPTDPAFTDAVAWALRQPSINLLAPSAEHFAGSSGAQTMSLATLAPDIVVTTTPMEILVTEGAPVWQPLGDSGLLYAANTSANIFQLRATMSLFVLVSGRWFTAASPNGPWSFVPAAELPAEFRMIPRESAKENVLASVPGTQQAQEAVIANGVPQMAKVPLAQSMPLPDVGGATPRWERIEGTGVEVLANCTTPVFRTAPDAYWSVVNGIWFTAPSLAGVWRVATAVDAAIYAIPPSSPYYFVTFVRVYSATPEYVVMGYTPGYFGAYTQGGVVVYGTGYTYVPYCDTVWVPAPGTYGCGASMYYNPWGGWAFGFGCGMAVGWAVAESNWCCGAYPYWGPYATSLGAHGVYAWGPGGWAATTGNCYQHWNGVTTMTRSSAGYNAWTGNAWATHTASSYNSVTGARAAGQRGYVENAYTGNWADGARGAGYNPTTGRYAAGKGVVAGDEGGAEVGAGRATVGNTRTGRGATVTAVKTDEGSWGSVRTDEGAAVAHNGTVYGMHDGNAYQYNESTGTWQRYENGSWSDVNDGDMVRSLDRQAEARDVGDRRAGNSSRWQSGGEGFSGQRSTGTRSTGSWGSGRSSGGGGRGGRR